MSYNGTIEVKGKEEGQRTPGREVLQTNKRVQVARPGEIGTEQRWRNTIDSGVIRLKSSY